MAAILDRVAQKISQPACAASGAAGRHERLTRDDALELFATRDLIRLGRLADQVKRSRWADRAHFVINRQINPSNICVLSCKFCDFATKRGRPNAYEMTIQEVLQRCSPDLR